MNGTPTKRYPESGRCVSWHDRRGKHSVATHGKESPSNSVIEAIVFQRCIGKDPEVSPSLFEHYRVPLVASQNKLRILSRNVTKHTSDFG